MAVLTMTTVSYTVPLCLYLSYSPPTACAPYAFQVYLRSIASKHVQGEVNAADIEKDVKREFGIDLTGKLAKRAAGADGQVSGVRCPRLSHPSLPPMTKAHCAATTCSVYGSLRTANCTLYLYRIPILHSHTAFSTTGDLWQGCSRT